MTLEEELYRAAQEHGVGDSLIPKIRPLIEHYGLEQRIDELRMMRIWHGSKLPQDVADDISKRYGLLRQELERKKEEL